MKTIKINNRNGIHARPASLLAEIAKAYSGTIYLSKNGRSADMKSIMSILSLCIEEGDEIAVEIHGNDQEKIFYQIETVIKSVMNE